MVHLVVEQCGTPAEWTEALELIREYVEQLPFVLDFQDLDGELVDLPVRYAPPEGAALLVRHADGGAALGFVGLSRFEEGVAELKRMYTRPDARRLGAGGALLSAAVLVAEQLGYHRILLDTVASLSTAIAMYERAGFVEVDAYRFNPRPDARYFALELGSG